jgi:solute carrier family 12 (sodium/potassium/chloride transporter), member 2
MAGKQFNAFTGVFVPTFLSIIGVIMFLRLGYIVGSAGIFGTLLIIFLAASITMATALSLSSITTNIRIGSGAAYSIISKTLGVEVGGSVGIPLFLAQTFSVVLYILGFSEAWQYIFPAHPMWLVSLLCFLVLFLITAIDIHFAVKAQIVVLAIVLVSLVSIFLGGNWLQGLFTIPLVGGFSDAPFWGLFALFFPAVTGLMAGVGLSGELSDPKRQIPKGILAAIGVTSLLYVAVVIWLGYSAHPAELIADKLLIVKLAAFAPAVLAGILAATFSSALTTVVAAPRLLQSLGNASILPYSSWFAKKTARGEPLHAMLFTSGLILICLSLGSLDTIAPILTMFFLITYAMLNLVVFIEQSLGLVSFRPTFCIPRIISLYGAVMSIVVMFFINTFAGILSLVFLSGVYMFLVKRKVFAKEGDIRSGLLIAISEWASKKIMRLPESKHAWKPNVILPVVTTSTLLGNFPLIKSIVYPNGTMTVLGLDLAKTAQVPTEITLTKKELKQELKQLPQLVKKFDKEGLFTSTATVTVDNYTNGICVSLEAIEAQPFHPNILYLPFKPNQLNKTSLTKIFRTAKKGNVGVILFDQDEDIGLGSQEDIHIWISPKVLERDFYADHRFDLALLVGYRLHKTWVGQITLWMSVKKNFVPDAERYLKRLIYEARFPASTQIKVSTMSFAKTLKKAPRGDLHVIPIRGASDMNTIRRISQREHKSFLFVMDSTLEDVLA